MLDKFGRTLLFVIFIMFIVMGLRMALKLANPAIRKVSPSLADTLAAVP